MLRCRFFFPLVLICLFVIGCFSHPTKTSRPKINVEPWQEKTVTSAQNGQNYRYLFVPGPSKDSPSILLLPGGIFDHRIWLNAVDLSRRFNVYALDWPDRSPSYQGSISNMGHVAFDFLNSVGIKKIYVAGVSAGAWAAIELAGKKQIEVAGLVLISTVMLGISKEEIKQRTSVASKALRFKPDRLRAFIEYQVSKNQLIELQKEIFYIRPYSYYEQLFKGAKNQGAHKQSTTKIYCPVLIIHGDQDETMPIETARLSPSVFNNAQIREIQNADHSLALVEGKTVARLIIEYFFTPLQQGKPND